MEKKLDELALQLKATLQALATLEEVLTQPFSLIVRDATIQRFEYTFELAWRLMRKAAKIEGIEVGSPRQAVRAAFDLGLLDNVDIWFEMLEDRNRTSHTYNERTADEVFATAKNLPQYLRQVVQKIEERY